MHGATTPAEPESSVTGAGAMRLVQPAADEQDGDALTVLLVGEQQVLLAGVRQALESDGERVVGATRKGAAAAALVASTRPDVVLGLAPLHGGVVVAVVDAVRATAVATRIVVISADDDATGELLLAAMTAGADGWLSLELSPDRLGRTLRAARGGEPASPGCT